MLTLVLYSYKPRMDFSTAIKGFGGNHNFSYRMSSFCSVWQCLLCPNVVVGQTRAVVSLLNSFKIILFSFTFMKIASNFVHSIILNLGSMLAKWLSTEQSLTKS